MDENIKNRVHGLTNENLVPIPSSPDFLIHQDVLEQFQQLKKEAAADGIELRVISSYRDYERQKMIWNNKAQGKRPILDDQGQVLDPKTLTNEQKVRAILRWSALPGCSRHHWGTDLDIYDHGSLPEGYQIKLTPDEYETGGVFERLGAWLTTKMNSSSDCGFFRPYHIDRGGVAPEPWHLSFKELADLYMTNLNYDTFCDFLDEADFELIQEVRALREEIYHKFISIN
jgi:LAS superfamily LD-carboxypeptidase LdcB